MPDSNRPNNWPAPTAEANPHIHNYSATRWDVTIHGVKRSYRSELEAKRAVSAFGWYQDLAHRWQQRREPAATPKRYCPACGTELDAGDDHCLACGEVEVQSEARPAKVKRTNAALAFVAAREEQAQALTMAEARTMRAMRRSGGNPTVHTAACHTRVARQWNGDYRNLPRSPTPGCQGCDAGKRAR